MPIADQDLFVIVLTEQKVVVVSENNVELSLLAAETAARVAADLANLNLAIAYAVAL